MRRTKLRSKSHAWREKKEQRLPDQPTNQPTNQPKERVCVLKVATLLSLVEDERWFQLTLPRFPFALTPTTHNAFVAICQSKAPYSTLSLVVALFPPLILMHSTHAFQLGVTLSVHTY
jgi:hypothetical protein